MERATPLRNPHASTSDLLVWPELPPTASQTAPAFAPRSHQPSDRINLLLFGGQVTEEEAATLAIRKPCSQYKEREMTGNGIFETAPEGESYPSNPNPNNSRRLHQQTLNGMSQISFGGEASVSPRKAASLTEVAKQKELTGTLENETEMKVGRQTSAAKSREMSGHDIFGPPPEIIPRSPASSRFAESRELPDPIEPPPPRTVRSSVKVSNPVGGQSSIRFGDEEEAEKSTRRTPRKANNQKVSDLVGNDIFKEEKVSSPSIPSEKMPSRAKLMEMSGSDIFADGKAESKEHFRGVRQPPGGDSTITLL